MMPKKHEEKKYGDVPSNNINYRGDAIYTRKNNINSRKNGSYVNSLSGRPPNKHPDERPYANRYLYLEKPKDRGRDDYNKPKPQPVRVTRSRAIPLKKEKKKEWKQIIENI